MGVDEELVGVHCRLDVEGAHTIVVSEDLSAVAFRGEEELHEAIVGCWAWLIVWHAFHFVKELFCEDLVADAAAGIDYCAIGYACWTDASGAHLREVEHAVVDTAGLSEFADQRIV